MHNLLSLLTTDRQSLPEIADKLREVTGIYFILDGEVRRELLNLEKRGLIIGKLIDGRKYYKVQ